jgi:hypothetical protein
MSLLIVAAVEFEVLPLTKELQKKNISFDFFPVGIDPLSAARASEKLARRCQGKDLLYLGSCGSFAPFKKPYLVKVKKTLWMPAGVRSGISDIEPSWYKEITFPEGRLGGQTLREATVLTSPEISLTKTITRKNLLEEDQETLYENMELYPVAEALKKAKNLDVILGVTNEICADSRKQWKENFQEVSYLTRDFILSSLKGLSIATDSQ